MSDQSLVGVAVSDDRRRVVLRWQGGAVTAAPAAWLYDNAEEACDHASGHRRSGGLEIAEAVLDARLEGETLLVQFAPAAQPRRIALSVLSSGAARVVAESQLWTAPTWLAETKPLPFEAYLTDDGVLAEALERVARLGIVFLSDAGVAPLAAERAVARFGYIRETNYGRLFDVREEIAASHLAYTAVGLELHTDNPYRDPAPTLQLLHVIEAAAEGGESLFVDGFAHAEALRAAAPERFERLAETPVEFAYVGPAGERYAVRAPVIEVGRDGRLMAVRVNHRALRSPPLDWEGLEAWYEAYLDFYRRLHAPRARLERKLAPGELVMFDNRRLLHGRAAYGGAGGRRWLQGCYAERDGLFATLSRLRGAPD